ncbi:hypothetical protein [Ascidiimonas aurantiaca]|uniref:hypothetical protein n=1 Tax=Ascidiimonas aurantiaca TaxID=1685432 RepID=UPI0030EE9834
MIDTFRLLIDFGLCVLIWVIQCITYPGFRYYTREEMLTWHPRYVNRITGIVAPLMTGQAILYIFRFFQNISLVTSTELLLVLLLWALTFLQAMPLHKELSKGRHIQDTIEKLIQKNWIRTILWTYLFIWGLIQYFW